jgi:hypothetical protein
MSGNVGEWCHDWYGPYPASAQYNPVGASYGSHRVFRGGSWLNRAGNCRMDNRNNNSPGNSNFWDFPPKNSRLLMRIIAVQNVIGPIFEKDRTPET